MSDAVLRRGIAWNLSTGPVVIAGNLGLIALALRVADSAEYGAWLLCFTAVNTVMLFDLGMGSALVRALARANAVRDTRARDVAASTGFLIFVALAAVLAGALGFFLAYYLPRHDLVDDATAQQFVVLTVVGTVAAVLGRFFVAVHHGHQVFHVERLLTIGGLGLRAVGIGVVAWTPWGSTAVIAAVEVVAVLVVTVGAAASAVRRRFFTLVRLGRAEAVTQLRELGSVSLPVFVSAFATLAAMNAPLFFAGARMDHEQLAAVAAILRVYTSARTLYGWATSPLLPVVSALGGSDPGAVRAASAQVRRLTTGLGATVGALLVGAPSVMGAWLGAVYDERLDVIVVGVGLATFAHARYAAHNVMLVGTGHPGVLAAVNVGWVAATAGIAALWMTGAPLSVSLTLAIPAIISFEVTNLVACLRYGLSRLSEIGTDWALLLLGAALVWAATTMVPLTEPAAPIAVAVCWLVLAGAGLALLWTREPAQEGLR